VEFSCFEGWTGINRGSGSGLLAMMAVKLGAEKVVAIEVRG